MLASLTISNGNRIFTWLTITVIAFTIAHHHTTVTVITILIIACASSWASTCRSTPIAISPSLIQDSPELNKGGVLTLTKWLKQFPTFLPKKSVCCLPSQRKVLPHLSRWGVRVVRFYLKLLTSFLRSPSSAAPQLQALEGSVPRRTQTATSGSRWSLPDLKYQL